MFNIIPIGTGNYFLSFISFIFMFRRKKYRTISSLKNNPLHYIFFEQKKPYSNYLWKPPKVKRLSQHFANAIESPKANSVTTNELENRHGTEMKKVAANSDATLLQLKGKQAVDTRVICTTEFYVRRNRRTSCGQKVARIRNILSSF